MRLCRDRLKIILQPSDTRHKFRLCTGFTAGRPPLPFVRVTDFDFTGQKGSGQPLRIPSRGGFFYELLVFRSIIISLSLSRRDTASDSEAACGLRPAVCESTRNLSAPLGHLSYQELFIFSFYDGRRGLRRPSRRSTVRLCKWHSSSDKQRRLLHRKEACMPCFRGRNGEYPYHLF